MHKVGLAPNPRKKDAVVLASELAKWFADRGVETYVAEDVAPEVEGPVRAVSEKEVAATDLLVVLGGDGTMLRWSRFTAPIGTPMLGINFGQYGFITEIDPDNAKEALERVLSGDCCVNDRTILEATLTRNGSVIGTYYAMNDVVVSKGPLARVLGLQTYVNNRQIATYAADGIIVASPTGSTAYSLAAGGPVVHPDVCIMVVTPICPHTLNARSLVIPDTEKVQIIGECGEESPAMMLTVDGQLGENMICGDKAEIGKAPFAVKLIQLTPQSFYGKLQTRLRWGERYNT